MDDPLALVEAVRDAQVTRALEEGRFQEPSDEPDEESPWCAHCPEWLAFLASFCSDCTDVGSLLPSSSYLASEITACIPRWDQDHTYPEGRFILEVGAGTGVFTEKMVRDKMGPNDRLVLVEFKKKFYHILLRKFGDDHRITILNCSITNFHTSDRYHYIISGLPFNNFSADTVESILHVYKSLLMPGGDLAYFEYILLPTIKMWGLRLCSCCMRWAQEKVDDYCQTLNHLKTFREESFETTDESPPVYSNVPPARVITCRGLKHTA